MHSFQVIREVLQTTSAKQIAADMGLSLSLIYKWAEKPDPAAATASHNPLDRMDQLLKSTRDLRLIHWLCQRSGGFFIRNPTTHHTHPEYLIPATNGVVESSPIFWRSSPARPPTIASIPPRPSRSGLAGKN